MTDLYIGFMDEEVNEVLNQLVEQGDLQGRPVIVVERASPEFGQLFERDLDSYGGEFIQPDRMYSISPESIRSKDLTRISEEKFKSLSESEKKAFIQRAKENARVYDRLAKNELGPDTPLENLTVALQKNLSESGFVKNLLAHRNPSGPTKTDLKRPFLSVSQMIKPQSVNREALDYNNPIIVVRDPELGLQPNLARLYLDGIAKSIGDAGLSKSDLNVACLAAGGSANRNLRPGTRSEIRASYFVGAESFAHRGSDQIRPLIAFTSESSIAEAQKEGTDPRKILWEGPRFKREYDKDGNDVTFSKADRVAQILFAAAVNGTDITQGEVAAELKNLLANQPNIKVEMLKDHLKYIEQGTKDMKKNYYPKDPQQVSISVSSIGGGDIKEAGNKLGVSDVNMEDHHVLLSIGNMKNVGAWEIERLNCDPFEIEKPVLKAFDEFKKEDVSVEYYKQAILWGLKGTPKGDIPKNANWSLANKVLANESMLGKYKSADKIKKAYFYETTTKGNQERIVDPFFGEIAVDFLESLADEGYKKKSGRDKAFGPNDEISREDRNVLQEGAARLKMLGGKATDKDVEDFVKLFSEKAGFKGKDNKVQLWTRPGKWKVLEGGTNVTAKLKDVDFIHDATGNADRALYKSVNRMLLEDNAQGFVVATQLGFETERSRLQERSTQQQPDQEQRRTTTYGTFDLDQ